MWTIRHIAYKIHLLCHPDGPVPRLADVKNSSLRWTRFWRTCQPSTPARISCVAGPGGKHSVSKHLSDAPARGLGLARWLLPDRSRLVRLLALPVTALAGSLAIIAPTASARAACANPIVCEKTLGALTLGLFSVTR